MEKEKINFWTGVPTMYWALLRYAAESGFDTSRISENLKVVSSGGAPMPVEVMREFEETTRNGIKGEVAGLGKLVLGGLM